MSTSQDLKDSAEPLGTISEPAPHVVPPADGGVATEPLMYRTGSEKDDDPRRSALQRALFEELAHLVKRRSEERAIRRLSSDQFRKSILGLLEFISERQPGEIKVQAISAHETGMDSNEDLVVLDTCMDDQSFIVATILLAFNELSCSVVHAAALLLPVQRDETGKLISLQGDDSGTHESITRYLILGAKQPAEHETLCKDVFDRLTLARASALGYLRLKKVCREIMNEYDYFAQVMPAHRTVFEEVSSFLDWLLDDNFVFFGASFYGPKLQPEAAIGAAILRPDDPTTARAERFFDVGSSARRTSFDKDMPARPAELHPHAPGDLLRIQKTGTESTVLRAGRVVSVMLRRLDDGGRISGGVAFHGLFTHKALSTPSSTVPVVRRRLETIIREEEALPESHHYRATHEAFNALPIEFLFEAPAEGLKELVLAAIRSDASHDAIVHVALEPELRSLFAIVIVSQDVFTDSLREALQTELVRSSAATYSDHRVSVGFARAIGLYFYLAGCDFTDVIPEDLVARLQALCTPWYDQLDRALHAVHEPETAQRLSQLFGSVLPEAYQRTTSPKRAVRDIELFDQVFTTGQMGFDFFQEPEDVPTRQVRLRIYHRGEEIYLSDILPILGHFGFRVIDQDGLNLTVADGTEMSVDTFRIAAEDHAEILLEKKDMLVQGLRAVFSADCQSDPLNCLMIRSGLRWEEVQLLRAHLGYLLQIRPSLTRDAAHRVLAVRKDVTRALIDFFHARFQPIPAGITFDKTISIEAADDPARVARVEQARELLHERLRVIQDATEDRILRAFANLIEATIRTNFYRRHRKSHYVSFKVECAKLEILREPRPKFEIFVNATTVEGVHLRGGKVARGGIRWSDRDDYRTEVYGLMQTQMVKNVLIVPVGAKGGFLLKEVKPGEDRRAFADKMYETFIRGLLDLTDNIVDGKPVPVQGVVCYDELDPYLVVAADKGTAHLSDTANRLAREYGFWLGDAFASGGSAGYDHKVYGITARGAWACAMHHFLSVGANPERDPIRVVGIGDMSGDVFGNGLLLSRTIKLVGAFDHRHVFLDPDPDPESSFLERQHLFKLRRSSWGDYRKEIISKGGGTFGRTEKAIPLSPECRAMLGVTEAALPPEVVISRLLMLDVDMIWNGGIGTYIKASEEDNITVGDRVNDAVRVNAKDVRAKAIVEGGNLGITQRGRIEYARRGGRINTDAIDNSAGVDLSDHEVNLKILLAPLLIKEAGSKSPSAAAQTERALRAQNTLSMQERDELLHEIAEEVCKKVIDNNTSNAIMLTLDEMRSRHDPFAFVQVLRFLQERGAGIPVQEQIPDERQLRERGTQHGFFRAEHAKISAYMKTYVSKELLKYDPLRFPDNDALLADYFPDSITKRFRDAIENHLLLKELLATIRTNAIFKFTGSAFFPDLVIETDRSVADVALAYTIALHGLGATRLRKQLLDDLDPGGDQRLTPEFVQARQVALIEVEDALREATSWLLHFLPEDLLWSRAATTGRASRAGRTPADRSRTATPPPYQAALAALREYLPKSAPNAWQRVERETAKLQDLGLPEATARDLGFANQWSKVFPIAELHEQTKCPIPDVARVYLTLGQSTRLNAIILRIGRQPAADVWETLALRSLRASLLRFLFEFAERVLTARADPEWVLQRYPTFSSAADELFQNLSNRDAPIGVPTLIVFTDKLRKALTRAKIEPAVE